MGRPKIDNPLFAKTESKGTSLKVLNSKTSKPKESKSLKEAEVKQSKTQKDLNFKSSKVLNSKPPENGSLKGEESKSLKLPKFKTCEDQLLVRLRPEQAEYLGRLEAAIMKGRSKPNRKERITKNTIIRSAIDMIQALEIDPYEISNEEVLLERIMKLIQPPK